MRRLLTITLVSSLVAASLLAQSVTPKERDLYDAHRWFALRTTAEGSSDLFYKGASEEAFHDDDAARQELDRFMASHPDPAMLVEAHELLLGMDFRGARYRDALLDAQQVLLLKPGSEDVMNFLPVLKLLARYERQSSVVQRTSMKVELLDQNLVLPVGIGGTSAHYILDNGFSLSGMSESEAKRLGLSVHDVTTQIDSMSGAKVGTRIAVVPDVTLGSVHLKNVAFYVLPDSQPPFNELPPGRRGILGLQVVIALQHFQWNPTARTFTIFAGPPTPLSSHPNLAFDGSSIFAQMDFLGDALDLSLDSGAQNTILYPTFAKRFPELQNGHAEGSQRLTGVGGSALKRAFTVPSLEFSLGGRSVVLKPATVLLEANNSSSSWFEGNLGMNLLNQAKTVEIDFGAMTLSLH